MLRKFSLLTLVGAVALAVAASAGAGTGGSGTLPLIQKGSLGTPRFEEGPGVSDFRTSNTVPYWSSSFTDPTNGVTYPFTMVGTNPATSPTKTTVATVVIPIKVVYSNPFTIASDATPRVPALLGSPIFQKSNYVVSNDANQQYGSAIMRSEFNTFGNYGVDLTATTMPTQTITIPSNQGQAYGFTADGSLVGFAQVQWMSDKFRQLTNQLHIDPKTLPIFLLDNVYLYDGKDWTAPGACCILGYHAAAHPQGNGAGSTNGNGNQPVQTYMFASWMSQGLFGGGYMCNATFTYCDGPSDANGGDSAYGDQVFSDIHALSHEVSEWLNDPFGNNLVQPWAVPTAQQYGCTNVLETGDPVVGIGWEQPVGATVYHPEDEVFKSWFARENPSTAQHGNYTYMGQYNPYGFSDYPAPTC